MQGAHAETYLDGGNYNYAISDQRPTKTRSAISQGSRSPIALL
jgi:hypothetical protein